MGKTIEELFNQVPQHLWFQHPKVNPNIAFYPDYSKIDRVVKNGNIKALLTFK